MKHESSDCCVLWEQAWEMMECRAVIGAVVTKPMNSLRSLSGSLLCPPCSARLRSRLILLSLTTTTHHLCPPTRPRNAIALVLDTRECSLASVSAQQLYRCTQSRSCRCWPARTDSAAHTQNPRAHHRRLGSMGPARTRIPHSQVWRW